MRSKQRIVKVLGFASLSFSFVAGMAVAQQQLPSQLVSNNTAGAANMVEGNVNTVAVEDTLQTQPVAVNNSMSPVSAPVAEASYGLRAGQGGVSVSSAPATGIGGANTGNANTGGLQVQNVTVQANPDATATNSASVNSEYARAEMLRQRRVRSEVENETRLLERLEEGRLNDERVRQGSIETYYSSVAGTGSAAAASASATATANGAGASASASAAASSAVETVPVSQTGSSAIVNVDDGHEFLGMSSFSLSPFAGYRWFSSNNTFYRAQNMITTGVNLEGKFNQYLSFESAFTYGRDKFYDRYNGGYGYNGGGYDMNNPYQQQIVDGTRSRDTFEVTGGLKLSKQFNKVTPFISSSLGGMLSKYNIDNEYSKQVLNQAGLQRSTTQFFGNFGGGADVSLARNFSIGGRFDYQVAFNKDSYSSMNAIWGDQANRFRLLGSLQLVF